jgi:diguanylate cyclase (GGDEF)-like protein
MIRSFVLIAAIVLLAQVVNAYFTGPLTAEERTADIIRTLKITLIVGIPFTLYVNVLQARADVAADYFRLLSRTDPLTGLLNRRAFMDVLEGWQATGEKTDNQDGALLVLDLDHFKEINDQYGHDAGDSVLTQLAALFSDNLRSDDIAARLGGEEFAIALHRASPRETRRVAQRLRRAVEGNFFHYNNKEIRLTTSIGLVQYGQAEDLEGALRKADLLTYQSKRDGRNRISYDDRLRNLQTAA